MENLEKLRTLWKRINNADNQELLTIVSNNNNLDWRSQIYASQQGNDEVLIALFQQKDLCDEAKIYMARRGSDNVRQELLKEEKISNSIQTIIGEVGSLENVKTLVSVVEEPLTVQTELNILDRDEDDFHKTLAVRTNLSPFAHIKIAQETSIDVLKVFLQKNDLQDNFLKEIIHRNEEAILKRNNPSLPDDVLKTMASQNEEELLRLILEQSSLSANVFSGIINKSLGDNLLLLALKRKDLTIEQVDKITQKISPVHYGKILDRKSLLTSTLVTIAKNGSPQHISRILEYSFLDKDVQIAIVDRKIEDDAIALIKRKDCHEDTIKKIYTIYPDNTRINEILFSILDFSKNKYSKIVKSIKKENYDRILSYPNISNSILKTMVDKCTTAQCERILDLKNLNDEVLKEIILKKKHDKNIILRVMSEHELNEGIMKAIVKSKNVECISYLLQEDNLPSSIQIAIVKDANASIKTCLELLKQTYLCDIAQVKLAEMNKKDISLILSTRKDLCPTAQITLVQYGITTPKIRNKFDAQDEIARKQVINNLLDREALCNKAQELIASTGVSAYAKKLLTMRFVTPETKKLIALHCNCD